jgi:hypothetical protein
MKRLSRRGIHVRDYFWRELLCRLRGHKPTLDDGNYTYCDRCGDTLPDCHPDEFNYLPKTYREVS